MNLKVPSVHYPCEMMRKLRAAIDDTEVTLAFYGSVVYLAEVAAFGSRSIPPSPTVAISTVVATASVLYVAHVFASVVPMWAREGRLHPAGLLAMLRHDLALLISATVPVAPLLLAAWGLVSAHTSYQLSVALTVAMLFLLAVSLSRRDGLAWTSALLAGLAIVAATLAVTWLESRVH